MTFHMFRFRDPYRRGYETTDEYFERLTSKLEGAFRTIIDLIPEKFRDVLGSYYMCEYPEDAKYWESIACSKIIDLVTPVPEEEQPFGFYLNARAPCPLCGAEASSPFYRGFSLPEGLNRHLEGYGRMSKCPVMDAAQHLSEAYFYDTFAEAEKRAHQEQLLLIQQRKKTELLFMIEPDSDPRLIDELTYSDVAREPAYLAWAEQRLAELGFLASTENNVRRYLLELNDFIVFADLRASGKIDFSVYKMPIAMNKRSRKRPTSQSFSLRDNWTKNIQQQFQGMLSVAVENLIKGAGATVAESYRVKIGAPTVWKTTIISPTFDARTEEEKAEAKRQNEIEQRRAIGELMRKYDREKLYREVWSEAIQHVAKRYGLSDVGLAKICQRLLVPRPPRGYWAKRAAGKAVPPIPELPIYRILSSPR